MMSVIDPRRRTIQDLRYKSKHRKLTKRDVLVIGFAILILVLVGKGVYRCLDLFVRWMRLPKYANRAEMNFRRERFPSVEDRVRLYMSNWYKPPCDFKDQVVYKRILNTTKNENPSLWASIWGEAKPNFYYELREVTSSPNGQRIMVASNKPTIARLFYLDETELYNCYWQLLWSIRYYCSDSSSSILKTAKPDIGWEDDDMTPVLVQFSDETLSLALNAVDLSTWEPDPRIPHMKKIRYALPPAEIYRLTKTAAGDRDCHSGPRNPPKGMSELQPIILLLNIKRHYHYTTEVPRYDIDWKYKLDAAIFRGLLTGFEYDADASDEENCQNLIRCKLVYEYANSPLVDAKLTGTFDKFPEIFHGINMTEEKIPKREILKFKGIIILEGNDVSSGLKWGMVSKSVVLMPPPRFTSWAMEELLEPWVHYIPINRDLSDVEEKIQWMLSHQAEAQRISHRATLWVLDLHYHPDAFKDNRLINAEILRRYRAHFRSGDTLSAPRIR